MQFILAAQPESADEWQTGATREEMRDAKLPMAYRDSCAHLLIPLNRCRYETYYMPWKCEVRVTREDARDPDGNDPGLRESAYPCDMIFGTNPPSLQIERHSYEKCQYDEFKKRVAKMNELREAKGGARSN